MTINYHVVLRERPGEAGAPRADNFGYSECPYPSRDLKSGEILIKSCYLSVDPALRCRMNEDTGVDYTKPWQIRETVSGFGGIGVVVDSRHPDYHRGDLVQGLTHWPWMLYFVADVKQQSDVYQKVDKNLVGDRPSLAISLTLVGLTALLGIEEKGHVTSGAKQTCVVSGAAGATGSLAGQILGLKRCPRVVGICGSQEKCDWLVNDLGFSQAINYKEADVETQLEETCPDGIDIYFDNVGGEISDAVIKQMNKDSHVILCGQISQYNKDVPYPPPLPADTQRILAENNITRDRFLVLNYPEKFKTGVQQLFTWALSGKLKVRETITKGLDNAGHAFVSLMNGGNIGKQLVQVSDPWIPDTPQL